MPNITALDNLPTLLFGIVSVTSLILYLLEHRSNQELVKRIEDTGFKKTEEKTSSLLRRALDKAKKIIFRAQEESIVLTSESKSTLKRFESEYERQLSQELSRALDVFNKYLEELKKQSKQAHLLSEESIKTRSDEIFRQFESNLSIAMDSELAGVRAMIEDYKKQQLSLVEENIIAMLEKTLSLVVGKKISLGDQIDLVYEALDKAKAEKFIM